MTYICRGTVVKTDANVQGVVLATDNKTKVVVIEKSNGGVVACPVKLVQVISYQEVR